MLPSLLQPISVSWYRLARPGTARSMTWVRYVHGSGLVPSVPRCNGRRSTRRSPRSQLYPGQSDVAEIVELPGAVPEVPDVHPQLLEESDVQVRQRRALRIPEVAAAADSGGLPADDGNGQVVVKMRVAVA